ncbi:MAG TPA: FliM/FliN family flagellar motor switch protein [Steroidobacteraceae bacterium]|nr:FliM/FliN family flagellar motor switch protein [Steroidobacteraceae bacterium]
MSAPADSPPGGDPPPDADSQAPRPDSQGPRAANAISDEEVSALLEKSGAEAVKSFDFTAHRINRTQLPMLQTIGKSFAERASGTLSGLLGRPATLEFTSIDSMRPADVQASLPTPGSVAVARLKPLPGNAFIGIEPGLLLTLLDAFFGGSGRPGADPQAAVSAAAQRFQTLVLKSLAPDLAAAWTPVSALEWELVKLETNPRLLQLGGPQESVIVVRFTLEFGAATGPLDWLLPDGLLAPVREALASDGGGKPPARKQESWTPALSAALQEAEVEVRAVLAEASISLRELVSLAPGDIIPIEAPQEVRLLVGEVALRHGRFGVSQGRNALKILPGGPS